jgi:hypothetical protein
MTHAQIGAVIDKVVKVSIKQGKHDVAVDMRITGYEEVWGSHRWLLSPVSGSGEGFWTSRHMTGEVADEVRKLES